MFENKKITKEDVATTATGKHRAIYTIIAGVLNKLEVIIQEPVRVQVPGENGEPVDQEQQREVGTIVFENGAITTYYMPYTEKFAAYMADFDRIVKEIINPVPASVKTK